MWNWSISTLCNPRATLDSRLSDSDMDSITVFGFRSGSVSVSGFWFLACAAPSRTAASTFNVKCQSKIAQINGKQVENLIRNAIVAASAHLRRRRRRRRGHGKMQKYLAEAPKWLVVNRSHEKLSERREDLGAVDDTNLKIFGKFLDTKESIYREKSKHVENRELQMPQWSLDESIWKFPRYATNFCMKEGQLVRGKR